MYNDVATSMKRDIRRLADSFFDVLVVGSGIYGATIAREAVLRGLKVALIEKQDFGHATSANSLKVIHGGLRYLQHGDIRRMRTSIRSRKRLLQIAPHLVDPLPCVMPAYGHLAKGREAMVVGLALNDLIGWDRNRGLKAGKDIPKGHTLSSKRLQRYIPGVEAQGLSGGVLWYDGLAGNIERLTLEFILAADEGGGCMANYVQAEKLIIEKGSIQGVHVKDSETDEKFDIRSQVVVNACGPWSDVVFEEMPYLSQVNWAKSINIVVDKSLFSGYAVGLPGRSGFTDTDAVIKRGERMYFFVPCDGKTLIGTTYKPFQGNPSDCKIELSDITELINEINRAYPPAHLSSDQVCFYHVGLVPMKAGTPGTSQDVQVLKKPRIFYYPNSRHFTKGLISVIGVKYTTGVEVAIDVVDCVMSELGYTKPHHNDPPLPGAQPVKKRPHGQLQTTRVSAETLSRLESIYGTRSQQLLELAGNDPNLSRKLQKDRPVIGAEVIFAIRHEMAQRLPDVINRRMLIGNLGFPGSEIIEKCATLMAEEMNWNRQQKQKEIESVEKIYRPLQ